jgi:ATP-dependent DNA ligase
VEPLWTGLRVLAHVESGSARFIDRDGDSIAALDLADLVARATLAGSAVLDGYLTTDTARSERDLVDAPEIPSAADQARQLLVGQRREPPDRTALVLHYEERTGDLPSDEATSFVAVDLLELDDEPLLDIPLLERKRLLESAVAQADRVRVGIHVRRPLGTWIPTWRAMGFRGLVFKAANGRYAPGEPNDGWSIVPMPRS